MTTSAAMQPRTIQVLAICLLVLTAIKAARGDADPGTQHTQTSSLDHYAKYAMKFLGLGDSTQQTSPSGSKGSSSPIFHTVRDQHGFTKYITYTSDGTNVYEVTVQMKPGSYPVIWSTPVKSKSDAKASGQNEVDSVAGQSRLTSSGKNENAAEDVLPMTLPPDAAQDLAEEMTGNTEDDNSTEMPAAVASQDGSRGSASQQQEGVSYNAMQRSAQAVRLPAQYGAMALYPVAYNPFTGQVKYVARPMNAAPSLQPTGSQQQGDAKTTLQPYTTTRPSPIPLGITTSGASLRVNPIPYLYPYMSYQAKNSRVLYQVPAQQINTIPSPIVQWVQAVPATRYQATYPQGYLSYQPAVSGQFLSALQSPQPSGQSTTVIQTKNTSSEMSGQS
ncbi:uncharacterized protein LOC124159596 isoform X2 [Ischnura elegans]|uniref:uncharacterized protein LOC124159596 isoform X2 n=1 Tax=Ischnura elegans TaxID=197161 RepID=UPI001ED892D7|nr:uncharacterized protein LOC124159596 isoform X2 [Ischnura elegans]